MVGYDWHVLRDTPPAHGSGKEPMYGSMGKSTKPDPNRKITYPQLLHAVSYTHLTLPTTVFV